ncbi:MAG: DUF2161 family putative PD-(D/E)XK-type phosphodiesterase [Motiliproteus sp.]
MKESDLYPPLKLYLESQGYEIKGEVGSCDVLATRNAEPPLIVELKLSLNLTVILQAVDRLKLTSSVYIGVPKQCSALKRKYKQLCKLLRMLGIGLITIDPLRPTQAVKVLLDPGEYKPRVSKHRQLRLLGEFDKRVGDPNLGGSTSQSGIVTAYRQKALEIAMFLEHQGPTKASAVALQTQQTNARNILYKDVYGWFDKVSRGIYQLSPRGRREIAAWIKSG